MRWILRALLVVAAVAIAWLGIVWSGVLPRVTPEQRAALAFLREMPPPPPGRNAFALLWAQPWAVPPGREAAILAEDLARFDAWALAWDAHYRAPRDDGGDTREGPKLFGSIAVERYGRRASLPDGQPWLCNTEWDADCVAAVANDPDAARAALAGVADSVALAALLDQSSHVRSPFPPHIAGPLPGLGDWGRIALNAAALRAHDGDVPGALADLCRMGTTWRRFRAGADTLVTDMVGIAYATVAVQQALAIHATAPADTPWPQACDALIAPLSAAELDQCNAARGEFALAAQYVEAAALPGTGRGPFGRLLHREHTLARLTAIYRPLCASLPDVGDPACVAPEQLFNPAGCQLSAQSGPTPAVSQSYATRLRDFDHRLALARAVRWWRAQPGSMTGSVPVWPDEFAAIRSEIMVDPAARTLSLPMRDTTNPQRAVFRVRF